MSTKIKLVEYEDDGQILEAYHAYPEASTSPLKTILSLFIISQENEAKHKTSKVLKEIFSIKENIIIS